MKRSILMALTLTLATGLLCAQTKPSASLAAPRRQEDNWRKVASLDKSLSKFRPGEKVTDDQKNQLKTNLLSMAVGPKPESALVDELTKNVSATLAATNLASKKCTELAEALGTVMNAGATTAPTVQLSINKAKAILADASVPQDQIDAIVKSLDEIAKTR